MNVHVSMQKREFVRVRVRVRVPVPVCSESVSAMRSYPLFDSRACNALVLKLEDRVTELDDECTKLRSENDSLNEQILVSCCPEHSHTRRQTPCLTFAFSCCTLRLCCVCRRFDRRRQQRYGRGSHGRIQDAG